MTKEEYDKFVETPDGQELAALALNTLAEAALIFHNHLTDVTMKAMLTVAEDMKLPTEGKHLAPTLIMICITNTIQNLKEMEEISTQEFLDQIQTGVKA